jgi:type III secretory pathway component EscS
MDGRPKTLFLRHTSLVELCLLTVAGEVLVVLVATLHVGLVKAMTQILQPVEQLVGLYA